MTMLRTAIVGCGKVADDHVESMALIDQAEVVACADLSALMAEQLATRYDIPGSFGDFDEMLKVTKPDVVHITTPPDSHLDLAIRAIEAGAHVFIEKPLALTAAEVSEIISAAESTGRKLTVGHSYWFDTPALDLRELVNEGRLGEIVHVDSWYGYNLSGDYGKAILSSPDNWVHDLPGGLFQNNIDHLLNKVMEFLPSDDLFLQASGFRSSQRWFGDRRDDLLDELRVSLRDPNGATANATFSSAAAPRGHWVKVYGTKGTATADFSIRTVELSAGISLPTNLGRLLPSFGRVAAAASGAAKNTARFAKSEFHYFAGFRKLLDLFYTSLQTNTEVPIPYSEMLRMARIQDEIWTQLAEQRQYVEQQSSNQQREL